MDSRNTVDSDIEYGLTTHASVPSWTRVMYWRRASIQDGQAPGDATAVKRFFHDNFVIFRRRSKRIDFFCNQWIYLRVSICKFSIFVMVTWPLFGTLQGPISTKCLVIDSPN